MILQAVRGMNDVLPPDSRRWHYLETLLKEWASQYGYEEIRLPIVEFQELYTRTVGDTSDIVTKEMYAFEDRNGDRLALRPEGTAGCMRAGIEHGLFYQQTQKWCYLGPMYRHERPQKGRYRQFYHFGVESIGNPLPEMDVELIRMSARLWKQLGIEGKVALQINTLGDSAARARHKAAFRDYWQPYRGLLEPDNLTRLDKNPLRILDSKQAEIQALKEHAPRLMDYLDETSKNYFNRVCELLDQASIAYQVNPHLVRGLDYYQHTVFEWVTDQLGAQGTVCAGGRYDGLIEQLGSEPTPATGFAIGLERLLLLLPEESPAPPPTLFLVLLNDPARAVGLELADRLREGFPALRVINHHGLGSIKSQFRRADKSEANWAVVIGESEVASRQVTIKSLREDSIQETLDETHLMEWLKKRL